MQEHTDFEGDFKAFANLRIDDERLLGDQRWRTVVLGNAEYFADTYQLDYAYIGGQTGPVLLTADGLNINPFVGGGVSSLQNDYYFSEAFVGATATGYLNGAYQTVRFTTGYRTFDQSASMTNGFYADLIGRFSNPYVFNNSDVLVFIPHARWSSVGGADLGFDSLKPGEFFEYGAGAMYYDQVADWLTLGVGFDAEQTLYSDYATSSGDDRQDWTLTPIASAVFNGALGFQSDIALDYRYKWNDSNDDQYDYGNHIITARAVTRF
jgi:hypothetical protein